MLNRKTTSVLLAVFLLVLGSAAYALPPRVSWIPAELQPSSTAPGQTATYTVTLKHTGLLPIPATKQLKVVAGGDIAPFVTINQPSFPPVFKRGNQVIVSVRVSVPSGTPMVVKSGELVLQRVLPNGKVTEVWRADKLPVSLTFSSIPLPPDPGEEGKVTIEGIDIGGGPSGEPNGVRDDIDRWIGFEAPNSEKKRIAMTLSAKAQQHFLLDYLTHKDDDPVALETRVKDNAMARHKTSDCLKYVFGAHIHFPAGEEAWNAYRDNARELQALSIDTPERIRNFWNSERPLAGWGTLASIPDDQYKQECVGLGFNPDQLAN